MYHNHKRGDEGSATEKPKTRITSSLSPRGAKLREEMLSKILPWQEMTVTLNNFPYYIQEHAKSLLVECVASNLKPNKLRKYCDSFDSSNGRILLQTIPGGELYRERLVSAVAREMKVPLLRLDDHHGCDEEKHWRGRQSYHHHQYSNGNKVTFKKGDRVMYVGSKNISFEELNNRTLSYKQRGEVYEVKGNTVAVVFNISGLTTKEAEMDEKDRDVLGQAIVVWLHENEVRQDNEVRLHDCYIAMEVLYEVLNSQRPMIVYFADSFLWPPRSDDVGTEFLRMVKNIFDQLPNGVVMICPENNWDPGLDIEEVRLGHKLVFVEPLKTFIDRFPRSYANSELNKLFSNVVCIKPPPVYKDLLETFVEQLEDDRLMVISDANLKTMHKVLKEHNLSCINLEHPIIEEMILKRKQVEKIIGWAMNHYFSSCPVCCVNEEKLHIPLDSIQLAIGRFMAEKNYTPTPRPKKKLNTLKDLASGGSEEALVSAVVRTEDISMKFDDVGVHENVKRTLYETVILPMRRPELFSHGNLLRSCKGILLFGPPGTGKTLIAKALTKESGANFINITAPTFTYMSFDALFSLASKLAPVIIYLDEMDTFDGARGRDKYGKSKLNEFIEAWDRCKSKESQRILLIGATNRPFDIDEAVIRQMPRRLGNRSKILKLILNKKNVEPEFSYDQLAEATEGYSGSDLKNLCIAAAYGPIQEFVEQKSKVEASNGVAALRSLNLNDFIHSKSKVRPSVVPNSSINMKLREWKEQYGEGESQRQQQI